MALLETAFSASVFKALCFHLAKKHRKAYLPCSGREAAHPGWKARNAPRPFHELRLGKAQARWAPNFFIIGKPSQNFGMHLIFFNGPSLANIAVISQDHFAIANCACHFLFLLDPLRRRGRRKNRTANDINAFFQLKHLEIANLPVLFV